MLQVVYASGPALPSVLKLQALARVVGEVARARGVQLEGGLASGDKVSVEGSLPVQCYGSQCVTVLPVELVASRPQWPRPSLPHPQKPTHLTPCGPESTFVRMREPFDTGRERPPTSTPHCDHEIAATGWHVPHGFPPCAASAPTPSHLKPPTVKCAHLCCFSPKTLQAADFVEGCDRRSGGGAGGPSQ